MLTITLILFILSNSLSLRRDKSILYSIETITILIVATLIFYENVNFKGIGIFRGLFHATSISSVFKIFILLNKEL